MSLHDRLDDEHATVVYGSEEATSDDPRIARMEAWERHGNQHFNVPYMTQLEDNLWHGGVRNGLVLPDFVDHIVSLHPWKQYTAKHMIRSTLAVIMGDDVEQDLSDVDNVARWINNARQTGTVLVHCEAGLNRSSLVIARALMLEDPYLSGDEAIERIRNARSQVCFSNPAFREYIQGLTYNRRPEGEDA